MRKFFILFFIFIFVLNYSMVFASDDVYTSKYNYIIELTEEEIQFLEDHPVMRVSNEMDLVPYDYVENGEPAGLSVEFLQEIAKIIGVEFEFINGYSWDELLEMFKNKEIDLIHPCTKIEDRLQYLTYSNSYMQLKLVLVVQDNNNDIKSFDDMSGKTIASVLGYSSYEIYKNLYPDMNIMEVADEASAFNAVQKGHVDAYYTDKSIASKFIEDKNIKNLKLIETYIFEIIDTSYKSIGIRDDWQLLKGIINKAIDAVPLTAKYELASKYNMDLDIFYSDDNFTDAELDWLKAHPVIKVSNGLDWYPLDYMENGQPTGISIEYMKAIANILDIELEFINGYTWSELINMFKNKQIDVMNIIRKTDERLEYTSFTEPHIQEKKGIVVNINNDEINDIEDLHDKTFAIVTGYASTKGITDRFTNIKTLEFSNDVEAIKAVGNGAADAYYGSEISTNILIDTEKLVDVEMKYYLYNTEDTSLFRIGVRNDWEIFRDIIQKAMKRIPLSVKQEIAHRYQLDIDVFYDGKVLTNLEKNWLKNNPVINIAVPHDALPYSLVDKNGNIEGMIGDIIYEMEKRLNVKFKLHPGHLANALEAVNSGTVDLISPLAVTEKRREIYTFSEPFFTSPIAIFSNHNYSYVNNNQLDDLNIMTIKNNAIIEFLRNDYPDIEVIETHDALDALKRLQNGEKAVFIGDLINTNNIIHMEEFDDVKVIGYTNYNYNMAFAMKHDNKILQSIINKTLKLIYSETGNSIQQKWLVTEEKVDYSKYIIAIIVSIIIIISLYIQLRINKKKSLDKQMRLSIIDKQVLFIDINEEYLIVNASTALTELLNINSETVLSKNINFLIEDFNINSQDEPENSLGIISYDSVKFINNNDKIFYLEYEKLVEEVGKDGHKIIFNNITSHILHKEKIEAESESKAKSKFIAFISHEIRTPMTTIIGITQLLNFTELNKKQLDCVNKLYDAGNLLLKIINDILDISKFNSGNLKIENAPFEFSSFIMNVINMSKVQAGINGHKLIYNIDENIPDNLIGDTFRFNQVLNNIISNAIKFTHEGIISISAYLVSQTLDDVNLKIIVKDTGIGMTAQQLNRLFEPFSQADSSITRKYGGSGLGMTISKQLIEVMRGEINVESIPGDGTSIIINICFAINKNRTNASDNNDEETSFDIINSIKGKRILVVEDHKLNQSILKYILEGYGLHIDTANDGIESLQKFRDNVYDLILMDIQMPVMDGFTATREIRTLENDRIKKTPILAMSAYAMDIDRRKSFESGMNGHLTKPIETNELEQMLILYLSGENNN